MKKLTRGAPSEGEAAHQEHITPEIEAGTEPKAYRRTTVTVERETVSIFTRRTVAEPVATPAETAPAAPNNSTDGLTGGKP